MSPPPRWPLSRPTSTGCMRSWPRPTPGPPASPPRFGPQPHRSHGDVRDEEMTGLFERDALMYAAARRRATLGEAVRRARLRAAGPRRGALRPGSARCAIGRLGVRDDDYEPLVIDWRAPAAAAFYRATPVEPMGVPGRRVPALLGLGSSASRTTSWCRRHPKTSSSWVMGRSWLLSPAAAVGRCATSWRPSRRTRTPRSGHLTRVVEISGGPGTGKTVVALHRAAYLLYSERRRFESGGILVVGPSAAYTAYIEGSCPAWARTRLRCAPWGTSSTG